MVKDRKSKEPVDGGVMKELVYSLGVKRGFLAMSYSPHIRLQPALTLDQETAAEGLGILESIFSEGSERSYNAWR